MTGYCTVCRETYTELDDITRHQTGCVARWYCTRHQSHSCNCPTPKRPHGTVPTRHGGHPETSRR